MAGERAAVGRTDADNVRDWVVAPIGADAFERLATGLAGTTLQSVLLEVMRRRAGVRSPAEVLGQHARDPFCAPALVDLRTSHAIDGALLSAADAFEAIELSPVAPLGTCSTVALTDQHRVLSALRGTEVLSDPTNVLALECARRMRGGDGAPVHLATSHRVLRAQQQPKRPGHTQHFRLFALASGGRETRDHGFSVETVVLHVRTMLDALDRLEGAGYAFGARRVDVLATEGRATVGDRVAERLGGGVNVTRGVLEHAYYSGGVRYQIWVTAPDGTATPLVDGGTFDWLATLTANRRAAFVATGIGAQLIALRFRVAGAESPSR